MKKLRYFAVCSMLTSSICAAQDSVTIILATIKNVDSTTKTIVVKTAMERSTRLRSRMQQK